jgi:hypothetical protein
VIDVLDPTLLAALASGGRA